MAMHRPVSLSWSMTTTTFSLHREMGVSRLRLGKPYRHVLTVPGRRTGTVYSTPVDVTSRDGERWSVAAYGITNWVRNARAAGQVTISRGGRAETLHGREIAAEARLHPVFRLTSRDAGDGGEDVKYDGAA